MEAQSLLNTFLTIQSYFELVFPYVIYGCGIIFIPLLIFKNTRVISTLGFIYASYFFALTAWVYCFVYTYQYLGEIWLYVGLFLIGIGIIPVALIGTVVLANYTELLRLLFPVGLFVVAFFFGKYLKKH